MSLLTKLQLIADIGSNIYTNTQRLIKGNTVKTRLLNIVDSTFVRVLDTAANFTSNNPILKEGEVGVETDTLTTAPKFKFGDGVTAWNSLPYASSAAVTGTPNKIAVFNGSGNLAAGSVAESDLATKAYADSLVIGLLDDRGNYDASSNLYPSTGGSGASGAILKGDLWTISVAGTLGGVAVTIGDVVRALANTPGQTSSNWVITENNIGYVPENSSNKATTMTGNTGSNTLYLTAKAINDWATGLFQTIITASSWGTFINGLTSKSTPVDADQITLMDSAASNVAKKLSWANIKATLKTYFDTLYQATLVSGTNIKTLNGATLLGSTNIGINSTMRGMVFSGNYVPTKISFNVYNNNTAYSAGATYFYLIENPTDMVVASLSVFCLTAAAGHNVRMCIYNVSGNVPTTPISGTDTGNLSCATTGQKEGTITTTTLLAQNRYMVALQASSTAIGLRTEAQPQNDILFTDLIYYSVIYQTAGHVFGTFLSNPTIAAGLNGNSLKNANIFLKIQ